MLYAISAFAVNRVMAFVEKKVQIPGYVVAGAHRRGALTCSDSTLAFVSWDIISKFVLKGFIFSVQLTVIATIGGIIFGTLLALMRLSGIKPLTIACNLLRQRHAPRAAGHGDPVVLPAGAARFMT